MNKTEMIAKIAEKTNTSRKAAAEMFFWEHANVRLM